MLIKDNGLQCRKWGHSVILRGDQCSWLGFFPEVVELGEDLINYLCVCDAADDVESWHRAASCTGAKEKILKGIFGPEEEG